MINLAYQRELHHHLIIRIHADHPSLSVLMVIIEFYHLGLEGPVYIIPDSYRRAATLVPGESKKTRRLKILFSLNIKVMTLKTISFHSRYVQLGSVIYPALVGHYFPSKWDIFSRKPFSKTCKNDENTKIDFPLFSFIAIITLGFVHVFCPLGKMESP